MPRGGPRPGAGRKPGSHNTITEQFRRRVAVEGKLLPLEYMLRVMRDESADQRRRDEMAKAAAPYLHARMMTHEVSGIGGGAIGVAVSGQVNVYLPDNGRRVAPPDAANDIVEKRTFNVIDAPLPAPEVLPAAVSGGS